MIYLSVDRIEEGYAICEDEKGICVEIDINILPKEVKESDIIRLDRGEYFLDKKQTNIKKKLYKYTNK